MGIGEQTQLPPPPSVTHTPLRLQPPSVRSAEEGGGAGCRMRKRTGWGRNRF